MTCQVPPQHLREVLSCSVSTGGRLHTVQDKSYITSQHITTLALTTIISSSRLLHTRERQRQPVARRGAGAATGAEKKKSPGCVSSECSLFIYSSFVLFCLVHMGTSEMVKTTVKRNQLMSKWSSWAKIVKIKIKWCLFWCAPFSGGVALW